jgi:hypothetical protein
VRKALLPAALAGAVLILVSTGISGSPGTAMREAATGYAGNLSSGNVDSARAYLTESLAILVGPRILMAAPAPLWSGRLLPGRVEARGLPVVEYAPDGSARTLWLRSEGRAWAVSGDTWLDGVLGSAAMICRSYALSIVPLVSEGRPAIGFLCPVTGFSYYVDGETGMLECPSGHLGGGLGLGPGLCGERRAQVASEVLGYLSVGYEFPTSLEEMWQQSSGEFGQRSGYRCPDNGYSYYALQDSLVWCPFHQAGAPVFAAGGEP